MDKSIAFGIGHVLAWAECLAVLCDVNRYREWLTKHHRIGLSAEFLPGYRVVLSTVLGQMVSELSDDTSLNLTESDTLRRVVFSGHDLLMIPNDSQKAVLLKNILKKGMYAMRSMSWQTMESRAGALLDEVVYPIRRVERAGVTSPKLRKFDAAMIVRDIGAFFVYIFLNDTSRNRPHGFSLSQYTTRTRRLIKYDQTSFYGYKYAVQYLWFALYPDAGESIISRIHESRTWQDFDSYFDVIKTGIIEPIERGLGTSLGFNQEIFLRKGSTFDLGGLVSEPPAEVKKSDYQRLSELLLWCDVSIVASADKPFVGVSTFIPLLIGSVALGRTFHSEDPVKVLKFVHEQPDSDFIDVSYAILLPLGSLYGLADYSGWTMFLDCCSNFGSTREMYRMAESRISLYKRKNSINLTEVRIGKDRLKRLLGRYRGEGRKSW